VLTNIMLLKVLDVLATSRFAGNSQNIQNAFCNLLSSPNIPPPITQQVSWGGIGPVPVLRRLTWGWGVGIGACAEPAGIPLCWPHCAVDCCDGSCDRCTQLCSRGSSGDAGLGSPIAYQI
jgi:hypothetical protein